MTMKILLPVDGSANSLRAVDHLIAHASWFLEVPEIHLLHVQPPVPIGGALAQKRLVTCGTGSEPQPPGISGRHAYAVLGFDAKADALTLWNPHGNSFKPKGEPGLQRGYPTRAGVFAMPVADFVRTFRGVNVETDKPVEPPKPAAGWPADAPSGKQVQKG